MSHCHFDEFIPKNLKYHITEFGEINEICLVLSVNIYCKKSKHCCIIWFQVIAASPSVEEREFMVEVSLVRFDFINIKKNLFMFFAKFTGPWSTLELVNDPRPFKANCSLCMEVVTRCK